MAMRSSELCAQAQTPHISWQSWSFHSAMMAWPLARAWAKRHPHNCLHLSDGTAWCQCMHCTLFTSEGRGEPVINAGADWVTHCPMLLSRVNGLWRAFKTAFSCSPIGKFDIELWEYGCCCLVAGRGPEMALPDTVCNRCPLTPMMRSVCV